MSDLPPGWARATAAYENDCNDSIPRVCRHCPDHDTCERDWIDCEQDAAEREAEDRWEAAREAHE